MPLVQRGFPLLGSQLDVRAQGISEHFARSNKADTGHGEGIALVLPKDIIVSGATNTALPSMRVFTRQTSCRIRRGVSPGIENGLTGGGEQAAEAEMNIHLLGHSKDEPARILQSPLNVGDFEARRRQALATFDVNRHGHRDGVGCAVESKDSSYLKSGVAGWGHRPGVALRSKGDIGEFARLQNLLEHLLIATGGTAVPGCR